MVLLVGPFLAMTTFQSNLPMNLSLITTVLFLTGNGYGCFKFLLKKSFIWICMHGKLLTNHQRMIRGLADNDLCLDVTMREKILSIYFIIIIIIVVLMLMFGLKFLMFRDHYRAIWRNGEIGFSLASTTNQGVTCLVF